MAIDQHDLLMTIGYKKFFFLTMGMILHRCATTFVDLLVTIPVSGLPRVA